MFRQEKPFWVSILLVLVASQDREGREQLERTLSKFRGSSRARPGSRRP